MPPKPGILYVVATPIGNLADLGERARSVLAEVDFVAAEDTRHTMRLLNAHRLHARLISLHEHNEQDRVPALAARLAAGESGALVSDAGTPLVSDPGYRLVRAVQDAGIAVRAVPGPSAVTAALSVSGVATDRFAFEGFLPARKGARLARLAELKSDPRTLVFYEAPHRLHVMLNDCVRVFGAKREAVLARELTKLHESVRRMSLGKLVQTVAEGQEPALGECVVLIGKAPVEHDQSPLPLLEALIAEGIAPKTAVGVVRRLTGTPKRELYRRAVELSASKNK